MVNGSYAVTTTNFSRFRNRITGQLFGVKSLRVLREVFSGYRVRSVCNWRNYLLLWTQKDGIFVLNEKGEIVRQFDLEDGMENSYVRSMYFDHQGNLWVFLDNGVHFIRIV